MRPFIIIRKYDNSDSINCKDLIKNYVMSFVSNAFFSCLFREVKKNTQCLVTNSIKIYSLFLFSDYTTINSPCLGHIIYIFWNSINILRTLCSICNIFYILLYIWFLL